METRIVFDLDSFLVIYSPIVILHERLLPFYNKVYWGRSYPWRAGLSAFVSPVTPKEQVMAQPSSSWHFLDKIFHHKTQAEHSDFSKESEINCTCKYVCSLKKTKRVNLIFAGGELPNCQEETACSKTDPFSAMATHNRLDKLPHTRLFCMIAHLTFQILTWNVSDKYFCLLYNSSSVIVFSTILCFYYYMWLTPGF